MHDYLNYSTKPYIRLILRGKMRQISENVWVQESSMELVGLQLSLRMTVIKLGSGNLWVHSPTAISNKLKQEVDSLGKVEFIVAASNGHNSWVTQWQDNYPEAKVYISGGIPKKIEIQNYKLLDENSTNIWQDDLEQQYMPSVAMFNESVFFHKKSKSLIVTDFIQNHPDEGLKSISFLGKITKPILKILGFKGKCTAPPLKIGFKIKDKSEFGKSVINIQNWDFDKIIVTHGEIIDQDAKQIFTKLCNKFV